MADRQLLAIFVSDVVGYSRLIAEDEGWTVETLRRRHVAMAETVAAHGGEVLKLVGDGMVAGFPSAVRAVECAVAIQTDDAARNAADPGGRAMRQRIGVNLGEVIRADGEVYGDGINVAARLEAIAPPGGIAISGKVHEEVAGRLGFPFADKGEQALKNIPRPVRVFEVRMDGGGDGARTPRRQTALPVLAGLAATVVVLTGGAVFWAGFGTDPPPPATAPTPVAASVPSTPTPAVRPRPYGPEDRRLAMLILPVVTTGADPELNDWADGFYWAQRGWVQNRFGLRAAPESAGEGYRGRPFDARAMADEQKVGFVVRTTARRSGEANQVLMTVYDRDGQPILERREGPDAGDPVQERERLARRLMDQAFVRMRAADVERGLRENPDDPDARDLFLRAEVISPRTPENWQDALALYDRAIELWPDFPQAWAAKAQLLWDVSSAGWEGSRYDTPAAQRPLWPEFRRSVDRWRKVADPGATSFFTRLLYVEALGYRSEERYDLALASIDGVLRRNPEDLSALRERGVVLTLLGRLEDAADAYERAVAVNDRVDRPNANAYAQASRAYFYAGRDDAALAVAARALQAPAPSAGSNVELARLVIVAIHGLRGNLAEARGMIDAIHASSTTPPDGLGQIERRRRFIDGHTPGGAAAIDRYIDGLRRAGWPE